MRLKILPVFDFTIHLLKKYKEIQQTQNANIYRIIEIKKLENHHKLIIQIIGKSSIIESSPHEIIASDNLLEGFSKKDVRMITFLACNPIKNKKYKIIRQELSEDSHQMIFKLREMASQEFLTKTANQIIMDNDLINNLSREDLKTISYIAGYECSQIKNSF